MSLASVTVDTTAGGTELLAANGAAQHRAISSMPTNTVLIFLKYDTSATALTAGNGIPLAPGATTIFERNPSIAGDPCTRRIIAITASGSADIRVQEL